MSKVERYAMVIAALLSTLLSVDKRRVQDQQSLLLGEPANG